MLSWISTYRVIFQHDQKQWLNILDTHFLIFCTHTHALQMLVFNVIRYFKINGIIFYNMISTYNNKLD